MRSRVASLERSAGRIRVRSNNAQDKEIYGGGGRGLFHLLARDPARSIQRNVLDHNTVVVEQHGPDCERETEASETTRLPRHSPLTRATINLSKDKLPGVVRLLRRS